jgi:hypothetical protein
MVLTQAGSSELHEPFTHEQPEWSSCCSNTFGYSRMHIHNHTHLRWQQVQTDPTLFGPALYGRVIDDVWIVQHNHGPFDLHNPPSGRCSDVDGCVDGISYDHWLPLLDPALADYRCVRRVCTRWMQDNVCACVVHMACCVIGFCLRLGFMCGVV